MDRRGVPARRGRRAATSRSPPTRAPSSSSPTRPARPSSPPRSPTQHGRVVFEAKVMAARDRRLQGDPVRLRRRRQRGRVDRVPGRQHRRARRRGHDDDPAVRRERLVPRARSSSTPTPACSICSSTASASSTPRRCAPPPRRSSALALLHGRRERRHAARRRRRGLHRGRVHRRAAVAGVRRARLRRDRRRHDRRHRRDPARDRRRGRHRRLGRARPAARSCRARSTLGEPHDVLRRLVGDAARQRPNAADYPPQTPATGNTQLSNCQRALLYAAGVHDARDRRRRHRSTARATRSPASRRRARC